MNLLRPLRWLHLVVGLAAAIFLIALGGSGALLVFEDQIDHALNARLLRVAPRQERLSLAQLSAGLERAHPGTKTVGIVIPVEGDLAFRFSLRPVAPGKTLSLSVDPYTGAELGSLDTANPFPRQLHQFHTNFLLGPTGKLIASWGAMLLLVLSASGLVLWWPRRLWRWPRQASGRRSHFDLHNLAGFYSSVFMLIFGLTGLVIHWDNQTKSLLDRIAHAPEPPIPPPLPPPPAGAAPLGADRAVASAQDAVPGARVTSLQGLGALRSPVRVTMKFPEDRTPIGRTNLYLHPITGEVLSAELSRTASPGVRVAKLWNREIHTGDILGWPTKLLAFCASLTLPLLAVTGPLISWGKLRRRMKRGSQIPG